MIRPEGQSFRLLAVLGLLLAGVSGATPVTGPRIDLGLPDPVGLEELPGIDAEEIALLRDVAGPGPGDLADRLTATGIPIDRLRRWAPYLEVAGVAGPRFRGRLRAAWEQEPHDPLRSSLRFTSSGRPIRWDLLLEETFPSAQRTAAVVREGRVGFEAPSSVSIWAGSVTGGIQGGNPWDDPLRQSGTGSAALRCFRMRSSRAARGVVAMRGSCGLAAWKREDEGSGFLLALADDRRGVWWGRRSGYGEGIGGSLPLGGVRWSGSIHRSDELPSVARLSLQGIDRSAYAAVTWALGPRLDQPTARFDTGASAPLGRTRIRLALSLLSDARRERADTRGMIVTSWGSGGKRASATGTWNERRAQLRAEGELPIRSRYRIRFEGRGILSSPETPVLLSVVPLREDRRARVELAILGRTGAGLSWPGIAVGESVGRAAVQLGIDVTSGGIRFRVLLLAPLQSAGAVSRQGLAWRVSLEQRGG